MLLKTQIEQRCTPFFLQRRCAFVLASTCASHLALPRVSCFPSHDLPGLLSFPLAAKKIRGWSALTYIRVSAGKTVYIEDFRSTAYLQTCSRKLQLA